MIDASLVEALGQDEASERRFAAQEIGETGDPDAVELLMSQLRREGSRAVKEAILRSLSRIWTTSPVDAIIELLRDSDPFVRAEAADMLHRRAGDAMDGLTHLLSGEDKDLRKFGIDILSQASSGAPDALYTAALKDDDINVVISAIESIGSGHRTGFLNPVLAIAVAKPHPMAMCACLETLAQIGDRASLDALRGRFPDAATVPGMFLPPFLKLLGGTAGPESIEEICRVIVAKGTPVYEVAIDALTRIVSRNRIAQLNPTCEGVLLGLLEFQPALGSSASFHLVRLLGHFSRSSHIAMALLPLIHERDRRLALTAVEALANSSHPEVEGALNALLADETDPEIAEELEELLERRRDGTHF